MRDERSLVERLRDYDSCHDGDVDEAADMLESLLGMLKMPTAESAVLAAMAEVKRHRAACPVSSWSATSRDDYHR